MEFQHIFQEIEQVECITIFRHINPDGDALGAQFGLTRWIHDHFPSKRVFALGFETSSQGDFLESDVVTDDVIAKSIAIVLDTANPERVDDQRYQNAKKVIKIDHHPNVTPFGDIQYVDDNASSTSEILATMFQSLQDQYPISLTCAYFLYQGILTDTIQFQTNNTSPHTFEIASYLANQGIDIGEINRTLFNQTYQEFEFANYIRNQMKIMNPSIGYVILTKQQLEQFHMVGSQARPFITEIGNIKELEAWCIFTEHVKKDDHKFDGSLRSKHIPVNELAQKYGGGGHKNAAGVKNMEFEQINELLQSLQLLIENQGGNSDGKHE